jgi:hypothetical protein
MHIYKVEGKQFKEHMKAEYTGAKDISAQLHVAASSLLSFPYLLMLVVVGQPATWTAARRSLLCDLVHVTFIIVTVRRPLSE